jgi:hypothetical protein
MNSSRHLSRILLLVVFALASSAVQAQYLKLPFEEVAQTADLIFIGTVDSQSSRLNDRKTMIFTDITFRDVTVVSATGRSVQRRSPSIRLTYAGGAVGDVTITVSDTPVFVEGRRYLIFMADDGRNYASPVIGGYQGMFEVLRDSRTGSEYLRTVSGKAVVGLDAGGVRLSNRRVTSIDSGNLVAAQAGDDLSIRINLLPALPADWTGSYTPFSQATDSAERPLRVTDFVERLRNLTLKLPIRQKLIRNGGIGSLILNNGGKVQAEEIKTSKPPVRLISVPGEDGQVTIRTEVPVGTPGSADRSEERIRPRVAGLQSGPNAPAGGALGACGYHNLNLVMEQVSSAWWEWGVNNDCMYVWNQAMDIYRYTDDDGSWGDNSENEFAGYPTSADVDDQYGFGWSPGALAMCITTMGFLQPTCGRIAQSDVCWNPAYSWTNDFSVSLNGTALLLRPINMHELGHTWGEQRGTYAETYDYDVVTVMHPYYNSIIEDGWGVHYTDAYLIRRIYDDQRGINGAIRDVGVESYYASNGLINSATNSGSYRPGDSITINNVTVENMGFNAASDLRIRFFLSTNDIISTADYQLGSYWFWTSFCGECYNVGSYTTTVPSNVPPGSYYVGAIVTINGFGSDDLTWNNSTYLYSKVTVTCAGSFSASPPSRSFASGGGTGFVDVNTAGTACPWTASSSASWLTITSGGSGTGSGRVNYSVASNTGFSARTGFIFYPGGSHTVTQSGGCLVTSATPISYGSTATGTLSTSDCLSPVRSLTGSFRPYADRYSFSGTAGQMISISMSSASFDTYLYLIGPGGTVVAENDDGGGDSNSRIPAVSGFFTLPSTGTYIIETTSFSANETGIYSLSLAQGTVTGGLQYYPLPFPIRLLDTRPGETACYAPGAPLGANATRTQQARGSCSGVTIPASARAIAGNATVVNFISTGFQWITLYPSDASQPNASNLNFSDNQVVANSFTVGLGADGAFKIYSSASTHFIVDITGYYAPPGTGGLYYHPLPAPVRLFDSRPGESACDAPGTPLATNGTRTVLAHRTCLGATIPSSARAIVGNATVVNFISSGLSWITLYPFGTTQPNASNINYSAGQVVPNAFIAGLSSDGRFNIFSRTSTHFIVDVTGYFSDQAVDANGQGLLYNPLSAPVRLLDTRPGESACDAPGAALGSNATRAVTAHRTCFGVTIPTTAKAVVGNATVVNFISTGFNWITLYPFGATRPNASNLNFHENHIVPNAFVTGLSGDGRFNIYSSGSTHFIVDLTGYFAP